MICYAYCLMDNHYHLFIKTTQPLKKFYHHIALGNETFIEAVSQAAKRFEQKSEVNNEIEEYMQKVITALKEV